MNDKYEWHKGDRCMVRGTLHIPGGIISGPKNIELNTGATILLTGVDKMFCKLDHCKEGDGINYYIPVDMLSHSSEKENNMDHKKELMKAVDAMEHAQDKDELINNYMRATKSLDAILTQRRNNIAIAYVANKANLNTNMVYKGSATSGRTQLLPKPVINSLKK